MVLDIVLGICYCVRHSALPQWTVEQDSSLLSQNSSIPLTTVIVNIAWAFHYCTWYGLYVCVRVTFIQILIIENIV